MKIHICLVSDQILANLIPVLMEKPSRAILVSTAAMTNKKLDRRLKKMLEAADIQVETQGNAPDTGLQEITAFAYSIIDNIEAKYPEADVTLNVTGGTKLMAMGFADSFRGFANRVIYTDTAHRRIETLPDDPKQAIPAADMENVLSVRQYIQAQGLSYLQADSADEQWLIKVKARKAAAKYLAKHVEELDGFIGAINRLADRAFDKTDQLVYPRQALDYGPHAKSPWTAALNELVEAKLIGWENGSAEIIFIDADKTAFLRGGWLEEYAYHVIADEKPFDAQLGVHVQGDKSASTPNEFDVLAVHINQLLFVECKTLRFNPNENDNELAYKLDSLGKAARGLFGETWLLSARPPSQQLIERLEGAAIRLIGPGDIPKLREHVQAWMCGVKP